MLAMCNVAVEKSNAKGENESVCAVFTSYFGKKKKKKNYCLLALKLETA